MGRRALQVAFLLSLFAASVTGMDLPKKPSWPKFIPVKHALGPESRIHIGEHKEGQTHHWCKQIQNAQRFSKSLMGQNVSVVIPIEQDTAVPWLLFNEERSELLGGYLIVLLEDLAKVAQIHWVLTIVEWYDPAAGENADDWLDWATHNFDVVAYRYTVTPERTNRGIRFSYPFLDTSPELGVIVERQDPTFSEIMLAWTKPFTAPVWWSILVCFVLTSAIYTYLEHDGICSSRSKASNCCDIIWQTFGSVTSAAAFEPTTIPGKLFVSSWMWVVLLIVSTYTANLASLMVVRGSRKVKISSIQEAVTKGVPVCVKTGEYHFNLMRERFPMLMIKPAASNLEAVNHMRAKRCAGVVIPNFLWEVDVRDSRFNPDCRLEVVGRPFIRLQGSFASRADVTGNCTDLVVDVLTIGLLDLSISGTLERDKGRMLESVNDVSCAVKDVAIEEDDESLPLTGMLGIFIVHGVVCLFSIAGKAFRTPSQELEGGSANSYSEGLSYGSGI